MRRDEEKNRLGIVSRTTPVASNNYFNYRINRCIHQRIMKDEVYNVAHTTTKDGFRESELTLKTPAYEREVINDTERIK